MSASFYKTRPLVFLLLPSCICLAQIGCGDGRPRRYPVAITVVNQDGQPIPRARVSLVSTGEEQIDARGGADEQGVARMMTFERGDGAVAGVHRVAVGSPPKEGDPDGPRTGPMVHPKFSKFGSSGLEITVEPGGNNEFTVEVQTR